MRPTFLLFTILLCTSVQAQYLTEQKNHISLTSGVNFNNKGFFVSEFFVDNFSDGFRNSPNFEIGLSYERMLSDKISLQTGATYIKRGYYTKLDSDDFVFPNGQSDPSIPDGDYKNYSNYHYLDIPLWVNWWFYQNSQKGMYMNVTAGPTISLLLSTKSYVKHEDGTELFSGDIANVSSELKTMPGAYLGFGFTKTILSKMNHSFYLQSNLYAQTFFAEHIEGQSKYQFGLNVGVGMSL